MKIILIAAALLAAPVAASAATTIDFNTVSVGSGHVAYAAPYTQYNFGASGPANVAGVAFAGTSGVDFGTFGFLSNGTQTAFLQSYNNGLIDGSFSLTGLGLHGGRYSISFDSVSRGDGGIAFTVSQGSTLLATYAAGSTSAFASHSLNFVSSGSGPLTFAVVNAAGDHSTAIDNITVTAVPEPATWGLMLAGFALTGFAARRRRNGVVAA